MTDDHDGFHPPAFTANIEHVAVDVEGVLAATHARLCTVYNDRHDTAYTPTDIDYWDWVADEIDFEEFMAITDAAWREEGCGAFIESWSDTAVLAEALARLDERFTVDVVTARTGVSREIKAWLAARDLAYDTFHSIPHTQTKAALDYDVYIDDKPGLADELATDQFQYLVQRPWNRPAWNHERAVSVESVVTAANHLLAAADRRR